MTRLDDAERGGTATGAIDPDAAPPRAPGDPLRLVLEHLREQLPADAAVVVAVDAERTTIEPLAWWYSSPELVEAIAPALRRSYDRGQPGPVEAAIERGRPLLLPRLEDWEAATAAHGWVSEATREVIGRASAIACPVRTALGRTLGAIVVLSVDPRRPLGPDHLGMATVVADLAAAARERAELLGDEAERAREEVLLKRAAESTSGTLEADDVEERVVAQAAAIVEADHVLLSRVKPGSRRLAVAARHGAPADAVDAATLGEVVRARAPVVLDEPRPTLHLPIELGPRLFGVLSLVRDDARRFDQDDLAVASKVARISAAALANAEAFHHERHLARTLSHAFVPPALPTVAGWEIGVLYEPADDQPTGGDLYGAWQLPTGEVAVVIGDVVGKGVETAALSAMARFFIEARSSDRDDPAAILGQAGALLYDRLPEERFVTAFVGLLDRRRLRYANAGHLAPVVVRADGALSETATGGLPLGIEAEVGYVTHELELDADDLLLGYTDGILEARRGGRLLGLEGVRKVLLGASAMTREPQALAELIHDEVRAWARGLSDDAAILAVRRRGLSVVAEPARPAAPPAT